MKCIADAPDFIAPEVNFTFGASNLNNLNFKDLPVFQRYMLQNAIVIMRVTKRNCKNFGRGKKADMQNIFPELSKFAFEFKYEDGHDYFHIFTIRDTDHSCWNWVSKPVKESICFKIALRLIIHLKHSLVLRLLHSRLCERKQKCLIKKRRRCQKCLFQKQATDSSNGVADPALHCGILTNALQVLAFSRKCDFSIE